jgi:hypothetical protein
VRREVERQEIQTAIGLVALQLIERIEHQHDAAFAQRLRQPERQGVAHFVGLARNLVGKIEAALQLA